MVMGGGGKVMMGGWWKVMVGAEVREGRQRKSRRGLGSSCSLEIMTSLEGRSTREVTMYLLLPP